MRLTGLDHVLIAIPDGGEDRARAFYGDRLGLTEVEKPAGLDRGGCWFVGEGIQLHLGVERPFKPAGKAHIAVLVDDLDAARSEFSAAGISVEADDSTTGFPRFYVRDPFGNRMEIISASGGGFTLRQPRID